MTTFIRNLPLSQKLMIAPCLFAVFLVLIGVMFHMDASLLSKIIRNPLRLPHKAALLDG